MAGRISAQLTTPFGKALVSAGEGLHMMRGRIRIVVI
jgi:hypothetical protein